MFLKINENETIFSIYFGYVLATPTGIKDLFTGAYMLVDGENYI